MARIRTIKPEFPQSESMGRVSRESRLCFMLLWTLADDSGRLRGNSRMLASLLYPYDDDAGKLIDGWLSELTNEGCIVRYAAEGDTYLQVCNWLKHQKIDKPSASKIPAFDESSRIVANPLERSSGDQGSRNGSRNGSRIKEGNGSSMSALPLVVEVFEHWKSVHSHPHSKLDAKRQKLIAAALSSYSVADLCQSISGYRNSPHHMGQNEKATVYDDIELMLRDAKHIDAGMKFAAEPPRTELSSLTRKNVAATEGWVPPEMRNAAG